MSDFSSAFFSSSELQAPRAAVPTLLGRLHTRSDHFCAGGDLPGLPGAEKNQKIHDEAINKAKKGLSRKRWEKKLDSNSTLGELGPWFTLINEKVSETDRQLAAMLVSRDAFQLAGSLEKLTGKKAVSQTIFGIGVVGMAVSTIIILMLINGFCLTEALGAKMGGVIHRTGAILPGIT